MTASIGISGDSPRLKWLLQTCMAQSPWLTLGQDQLEIDWSLALTTQVAGADLSPLDLSRANILQKLLPSIPLSIFHDLSFSSPQYFKGAHWSTILLMETWPLSPALTTALNQHSLSLDQLQQPLIDAAKIMSPSLLRSSRLHEIREGLLDFKRINQGGNFLRREILVDCDWNHRVAVAQGNLAILFKGTLNSYSQIRNSSRIRESMRLSRRLIRAQFDFYRQLNNLTFTNEAGPAISAESAELSESLAALGQIAQRLSSLLIAREVPNQSPNRFVSLSTQYQIMNLSNQEQRHESSRARRIQSQAAPAAPLADLIARTEYIHRLLILLPDIKALHKHHDLLEQAVKDVARVAALLLTENESILQQQEPLAPVEAIEGSIEWLIVHTPLLNLLCSGFLTFYTKNVKIPSYTLCLSPWLSTTVMAKKMLGSLPLTYLNQSEGENPAHDEADELEAAEESSSSLSGALIWERMLEQMW